MQSADRRTKFDRACLFSNQSILKSNLFFTGISSLYFPDYISFWFFIVTSFLLVYHIDNQEKTAYWIEYGIPFYPLVADVIIGLSYYTYNRNHLIKEIEVGAIIRSGKIILQDVPKGKQTLQLINFVIKWLK